MKLVYQNPFFTWLVLSVLTYTGVFWLWYTGYIILVFHSDFTRIAALLFCAFVILNVSLGMKAHQLQQFIIGHPSTDETVDWYDGLDLWYFVMKVFPYLGFMGTVIGLSNLMQTSTAGLDVTPEAIHQLMKHVGENSGAALYPTLVGGFGYLLIMTHVKSLTHSFMRNRYASEF